MVRIGGLILFCFVLTCEPLKADECQSAIDAMKANFQADQQQTAHNIGKIIEMMGATPQSKCEELGRTAKAAEQGLKLFRKSQQACGAALQTNCNLECRTADMDRRKQDAEKACHKASPEGRAEATAREAAEKAAKAEEDKKEAVFNSACMDAADIYMDHEEDKDHPELSSLVRRCNANPDPKMCEHFEKLVQKLTGKHVFSCGS
jgi:hypothetical protein